MSSGFSAALGFLFTIGIGSFVFSVVLLAHLILVASSPVRRAAMGGAGPMLIASMLASPTMPVWPAVSFAVCILIARSGLSDPLRQMLGWAALASILAGHLWLRYFEPRTSALARNLRAVEESALAARQSTISASRNSA